MKRIVLPMLMLLIASTVYSADKFNLRDVVGWKVIGIEQHNKKGFNNIIGRLEFGQDHEDSLSIVYFIQLKDGDSVTILSDRYMVNHKRHITKNIIYVEGTNQFGITLKGTIEVMDDNSSKVRFVQSTGSTLINITDTGKKFKAKYLPNVDIGYFK